MAWTNHCKVALKINVDTIIHMQDPKTRSVRKVLTQFSEESEIPLRTLQRWYKEQECANSDAMKKSQEWPSCSKCHRRKVEKNGHTGKPHGSGLCTACRTKIKKEEEVQKSKEEFDQTPIDPDADRHWRKFAEKLIKFIDENAVNNNGGEIVGKVNKDTFHSMLDAQKVLNKVVWMVINKSTYEAGG
jgi:hypothetical protein